MRKRGWPRARDNDTRPCLELVALRGREDGWRGCASDSLKRVVPGGETADGEESFLRAWQSWSGHG